MPRMHAALEHGAATHGIAGQAIIPREALERALALRDLSDPAAGPHAMQLLLGEIRTALRDAWGCEVIERRAHPVVSIEDCYDRLGYPPDAVTREARYTRYVDAGHVLRTHTTAMIPPLLREIAGGSAAAEQRGRSAAEQRARSAAEPGRTLASAEAARANDKSGRRDLLLVCPGLVYRRDTIDRLHTGAPHQCDLWRIRRGRELTPDDLREMVARVVNASLPGVVWRWEPRRHPYTLEGMQVDAAVDGEWIEILECGLAHPSLLRACGLDPRRWSGLAMGAGLDRLLMLRKHIPDIRLLRSDDPRIADQMLDLAPYRPISNQPAQRRDLSIATDAMTTPEEIGDRVRSAMGGDADVIESIEVLAETPVNELPPAARARIGIAPDQKNVLLRIVIRDPSRTLTSEEANRVRDRVYAALHQGAVSQWAAG